jgi:hypothetical protein
VCILRQAGERIAASAQRQRREVVRECDRDDSVAVRHGSDPVKKAHCDVQARVVGGCDCCKRSSVPSPDGMSAAVRPRRCTWDLRLCPRVCLDARLRHI